MKKTPLRTIKEPEYSGSFDIRDVQKLLQNSEMVQDLHRHNFFFILVLEVGIGEHSIDFVSYPVGDYSIFCMRPGQVHQLTLKKGSKGYLIRFNTDFYSPKENLGRKMFLKACSHNHCKLSFNSFKRINAIASNIFIEHTDKPENHQKVIEYYLDIFFIEMARQHAYLVANKNNSTNYTQERLHEFMVLLETHILTKKKVTDYAEMLHLTSYQLNTITKNTLGKTCSTIINDQIILEAKRNLLATTNQVNTIAYQLGYEDTSYFIRFFKKHTGYTPETFRQNFK
ncbi:AraC family transcriptional regulator [Neptunitalea chrysea]|uniref:AraC family transcriptional regulator n=1 Tax=Neptunitalea chrysea TaxID=1647581 RepID=A0A9W6B979_9FLAO|nr:AraC family transcriptional regulator [Neptunitalea chrysea]GLB53473.1 AraC family transcriptional regulator [Neptunitalea chrysea]